jgi:VanZ family protein/uncharacterized protein Usg
LHAWSADLHSRRFWADVAVNIGIYMPLGMSGYLAFRRYRSKLLAFVAPLLIGATLSALIEMGQLFTPYRDCSAIDLTNNILGTSLGILAGWIFKEIVDLPPTAPSFAIRDRGAVTLLYCWAAFQLFPFFPVTSLGVWKHKLLGLVHGLWFIPIPVLLSAAEWLVVGQLLLAAGADPLPPWLAGFVLLIPAQFAIIDHELIPADFLGPLLGCALFLVCRRAKQADLFAGLLLLLAIALRGLQPFHFGARAESFSWIPFIALLNTPWQSAITTLLGKIFEYGAAVWLLGRSFLRPGLACGVVVVVLSAIEFLQTRIPGHSPEVSDPLLAILLGLVFLVLRRQQAESENDADPAGVPLH